MASLAVDNNNGIMKINWTIHGGGSDGYYYNEGELQAKKKMHEDFVNVKDLFEYINDQLPQEKKIKSLKIFRWTSPGASIVSNQEIDDVFREIFEHPYWPQLYEGAWKTRNAMGKDFKHLEATVGSDEMDKRGPGELLKDLQLFMYDEANPQEASDIFLNELLSTEFINKYTKTIHKESLLPKREELIEKIIINNNLTNVIHETINDKSERITTKIYDNKINAILTYASEQKNCLRIYIQGHGGNPFSYSYHNKLLKFFVSEGCDFLSMSMTGLGINEGSFSYPSRYGFISLDKEMAKNHKNYSFFYDEDNPKLDPLTLFISPHYKIIKSLTPNYENISIMGISGGGWYSVWLSALIPKINICPALK